MELAARVTSKGQITIPKEVRDALSIETGDEVVFRIEADRAVLARTPDLLDVAGIIEVPRSKRSIPWNDVRETTRRRRSEQRH